MPVITRTSEFRPGRWIMLAAAACAIAYVLGAASTMPDSTVTAPPSAVCAP
ncbi:hypothetical protein [Saccharothrix texasensis]|uniref:Uncharacterized protein n=1 Tax=Saccharothrix texasensis TaxID=103734 RepID=A0A3N1H5D4_9PSEU|nr:hypothetical protein [Saccharothrix texasensis]ROP37422.1 hypothetical protein EDD40_2735 [Saccharothrix texasensis]